MIKAIGEKCVYCPRTEHTDMKPEIQERLHRVESLFREMQSENGPISVEQNSTDGTIIEAPHQEPSNTTVTARSLLHHFSDIMPAPAPEISPITNNNSAATSPEEGDHERPMVSIRSGEEIRDGAELSPATTRPKRPADLLDQILSGDKRTTFYENNAAVWARTSVSSA